MVFAALLLAGCATPGPTTLPGFVDTPSAINFNLVDARPAPESTREILSLWITSCNYGVYRLADDENIPSRLIVLRHDLEDALKDQLRDQTLTVTHYSVHLNARGVLIASNPYAGGLVGAIMTPNCAKADMAAGWYDPSELSGPGSPIIAELEVTYQGKTYSARKVSTPSTQGLGAVATRGAPFELLHQVDQALIDQLRPPKAGDGLHL
jgi:hypothetical protein